MPLSSVSESNSTTVRVEPKEATFNRMAKSLSVMTCDQAPSVQTKREPCV